MPSHVVLLASEVLERRNCLMEPIVVHRKGNVEDV